MKKDRLALLFDSGGKLLSLLMGRSPRHTLAQVTDEMNKKMPQFKEPYPKSEVPSLELKSILPSSKVALAEPKKVSTHVSNSQTIQYQNREISKELLLLEKHLQQHCKIDGKACDCCEKHPIAIEGLAQEALGMQSKPIYSDVIRWSQDITPKTTEAASASGDYEEEYPQMAMRARELRKALMGTSDTKALLKQEGEDGKENDTRPASPGETEIGG